MIKTKQCAACGEKFPLHEFPKKGLTRKGEQRYYPYCKACHRLYQRMAKLKNVFNLDEEEYLAILEYQQGMCACCDKPPKEGGIRLSIDHDHKTGLIRGLVCWKCNKAIGLIDDSPDTARGIAKHLERPSAIEALGERRYGRKGRANKTPKEK